ncbi:hypothetical protein ACWEQ8_07650 [Streptomyces noursei]|uniref:hypothetical protein n=1 Tax=Streptomyces noursei TaxID=1971 RepID=UPI00344C21D7
MTAGWAQQHEEIFGEDPWARVQRLAWQLTQRRIGYSPGDLDAYQAGQHTPEAAAERARIWLPASRLLALALWRAGRDTHLLVDDVPLHRALWWLGGARADDLYAAPLPAWDYGVVGHWPRVQERHDELQDAARDVVAWHTMAEAAESRPYEDSDRSLSPRTPCCSVRDAARSRRARTRTDTRPAGSPRSPSPQNASKRRSSD